MNQPAINMDEKQPLGIFDNIHETDYHASKGISKHGLDLINRSPAHYKQFKIERNAAMAFGSAVHCMVLEPDKWDSQYCVNTEFKDFRTKAAKEWREEMAQQGKTLVSLDDYAHITNIATEIHSHPYASVLLDHTAGKAEQSCYWIDNNKSLWNHEDPTYRLCRCRPDFINEAHNLIIDLKTCLCAGESKFAKDVVSYRYHVQAAFYLDGLMLCGKPMTDFKFVAVEKTPPYGIGVYELDRDDIRQARLTYQLDLQRYHKCMTENKWPGYPEQIRTLTLPGWARFVDVY